MNIYELEVLFEKLFGHLDVNPFNKNFLMQKIEYYKETDQKRPDLYLDLFIYENYDAFEQWCIKTNKQFPYQDMEFKVIHALLD